MTRRELMSFFYAASSMGALVRVYFIEDPTQRIECVIGGLLFLVLSDLQDLKGKLGI